MRDPADKDTAAVLAKLDLHGLFRFTPQTQDISKLRQSLLVKKLTGSDPIFGSIHQLADFLDDRIYEHSNAALNIVFSYTGDDLRRLLENDEKLRIEVGNYQKFIPKQEVDDKSGRRHIPAHYESTPVFDHPHVRSLLKGKNRSNLTLLLFKLFFKDYPQTPELNDFNLVCEVLRPKLRTIDYGLLLNYAAQPCQPSQLPDRYYTYLQHLKAATALLNYIMEHQSTNSARKLQQAFFHHLIGTIRDDVILGPDEKMKLLQMSKFCFEYTLLSDEDLVKNAAGLFAKSADTLKFRFQEQKQIIEKEFIYAAPDPLDAKYLDKEAERVLSSPQAMAIRSANMPSHLNKKMQAFDKQFAAAAADIKPSIKPGGNSR